MFQAAIFIIGVSASLVAIGLAIGAIFGLAYAVVRIVLIVVGRTILAIFWTVELLEAVLMFLFSSRRRAIRRARLAQLANGSTDP